MVSRKVKSKRSKLTLIMLLPALIFIGAAGWFMYAMGDNHKTTYRKQTRPSQKDNVTFLPTFLEDQQEIRIHNSTNNN